VAILQDADYHELWHLPWNHHHYYGQICAQGIPPLLPRLAPSRQIFGLLPHLSEGTQIILNTYPFFVRTDYGVTRAYLVPPIILQLCKDPLASQYDLSKLRSITSAAAPLGPGLQKVSKLRSPHHVCNQP